VGSVAKRPDGKYRARWRDLDGKEHSKHFTLKRDADKHVAKMEGDKLRGVYVDPTDRTTVAEYTRRWAAARPHKPRTACRIDSMIKVHVEGTSLGGRRLGAVLPSDAQAWVSGRAKVMSPSTLKILVGLMRSVYGAAVADTMVHRSPFAKLSMPESHRERVVPLSIAQVRALADAVPDRCRAMVLTQAGLGLRIGELRALRAMDVDFLRRTARVEGQLDPGMGKARRAPKTPLSRRTLPLPRMVGEALAAHMATYPDRPDTDELFVHAGGDTWSAQYYSTVIRRGVKAAGLPEGTTSHDLRHHYASVLLMAGESVVAVAERLGHQNASLVLSTYGHLMPDSEDRTRRAIDTAWEAESGEDADQGRTGGLASP